MEKVAIPESAEIVGQEKKCARLFPYFVATAAVSALVVVCVLGSLYIHQLKMLTLASSEYYKTDKKKETYEVEYNDDTGKVQETITVDEENKNELIIQRNFTGFVINVVSADFNKGVMAVYSRGEETCYIVIGAQTFLPTWESVQDSHKNHESSSPQEIELETVSDTDIEDKSVLPDDILGFCLNKPLYWAKPVTENNTETHNRMRRGKISASVEIGSVKIKIKIEW